MGCLLTIIIIIAFLANPLVGLVLLALALLLGGGKD